MGPSLLKKTHNSKNAYKYVTVNYNKYNEKAG